MSSVRKRNYTDRSEYTALYSDMHGVDLSGDGSAIPRTRFAYLENMYRDYEGGSGAIESVPGYRKILDTGATVYGMFSFCARDGRDMLVIHSGRDITVMAADGSAREAITAKGIAAEKRSTAFYSGGALYLMDTEKIIKVTEEGAADAEDEFYVPCVALNGEDREQRNLLTRRARERYVIGSPDDISFGTPGISYTVLDSDERTCSVAKYLGTDTRVYVPARVKIGNNLYTVRHIGASAFADTQITECYIAGGVTHVMPLAFYGCRSLHTVILSDSVTDIGNGAFTYCSSLTRMHFGLGLSRFGTNPFGFAALTEATYAGTADDFSKIENASVLGGINVKHDTPYLAGSLGVEIVSPAISVEEVTLGGEAVEFETFYEDEVVRTVRLDIPDKSLAAGKTVEISLTLASDRDIYAREHFGFVASMHSGGEIGDCVTGCRISASFDGRIFLTGNPTYPGVCFFSATTALGEGRALYFGEYNYFRDGDGSAQNVALLPLGDKLAVFKERQDGEGSIFYHTPESTGEDLIPTVYPTVGKHGGIFAKGAVALMRDDPVFITDSGLCALVENELGTSRHVASRSHPIDPMLLGEELSGARLAVWCGYLVLAAGGRMYLADSRDTCMRGEDFEYEWYLLTDVGAYSGDERVYRYAAVARDGLDTYPKADAVAEGEIMSAVLGGSEVLYVKDGAKRYEVYPTAERRGGTFHPATEIAAVGKRLYFAAEDGSISVFNNDMRGVAPELYSAKEGFDAEEYREAYGNIIHPELYSHAGHAVRYALRTRRDDCGIPHLPKSTVKNSLCIKCRAAGGGRITVEAGCDRGGYREVLTFPSGALCFSELDFAALALITDGSFTVPIAERRRGWVEKQISVYSDDYASPIGIYTIAYRFTVGGRIKLNSKGGA